MRSLLQRGIVWRPLCRLDGNGATGWAGPVVGSRAGRLRGSFQGWIRCLVLCSCEAAALPFVQVWGLADEFTAGLSGGVGRDCLAGAGDFLPCQVSVPVDVGAALARVVVAVAAGRWPLAAGRWPLVAVALPTP
jgi:hypothetical protein